VPGTLVTFHAHPDDECITTGGVMAKAAAEGHRVVLVVATGGEVGEVDDGVLAPGETLAERRLLETARAAEILGVARVVHLGYRDSGMEGTADNDHPDSFWTADRDEAAARLAAVLREEDADVLTIYDERGGYGHPDHIQVHRVGVRAAALAGTPRVYEATMNRDEVAGFIRARRADPAAADIELPDEVADPDEITMGTPEAFLTTRVDVADVVDRKRAALGAHASQVDETHFFLAMPVELFREAFGTEWFIRRGAPAGVVEDSLFPDELAGTPGSG
jgi:LmbE family N-acetylglucosaminyl deacetylase